jgi:hypothetical protein
MALCTTLGLYRSLYGYTLATLRATGRPVHRNFGLVTERNLNVRTATLRVGHLARGLYATVTTRIHFDWTTSFLSDALIL